jgi:hypothetical protein
MKFLSYIKVEFNKISRRQEKLFKKKWANGKHSNAIDDAEDSDSSVWSKQEDYYDTKLVINRR